MKTTILFSITILWIGFICPGVPCNAAVQAGKVAAVRGSATAMGADGAQRELALESPIYREDTLKTGERGRLQVLFNDSTIISIGPQSQMIVAEFEWDGSAGKMENRVKEGFFHIMGGNIAKQSPENFNTQTPIATIGIRGSTYALSMIGEDLNVVFIGGTGIFVSNAAGRLEITRPGYGTTVRQKESKPPALKKFSEKELGGIMQPEKPVTTEVPEKAKRPAPERSLRHEKPELAENPAPVEIVDGEVDRNQQIIHRQTPVPGFSGDFLTLLTNPEESRPVINESTTGTLSGVLREAYLYARGEPREGEAFLFDFGMPVASPGEIYTGFSKRRDRIDTFPINGFFPDGPIGVDRYDASLGEFVVFSVPMESVISLQKTYQYGMLGFLGLPAIQQLRPMDVIYSYSGPAMRFTHLFSETFIEGGSGLMKMKVNWHNNRFIGVIEGELGDNLSIPFFGTLKGNQPVVDHAVFLGNFRAPSEKPSETQLHDGGTDGGQNNFSPISWITGSDTGFGRFYGSAYQGFGGVAGGGIVDIQSDQTRFSGKWDIAAGAFRSTEIQPSSYGKVFLEGFASGIGDNMTAPHIEPRFFQNRLSSDFRIEIDRDAGTLKGTLSARDFTNDARALSHIEIGGNYDSAYIDDNYFLALMGSENGVSSSGQTGGLKPYGNHLQPGKREEGLAAHTSWGYWEVAYDDPATGEPIHVHMPGSLWIAGEVTPAETVKYLIETQHIGHYEGRAKGVLITPGPQHLLAMDGGVDINIDFSPSSAAPVTGSIRFSNPGLNLVMERGSVGATGFSGSFKDTLKSNLNGGFFGPNADSVAGNFAAVIDREKAVTGIFGADRIRP